MCADTFTEGVTKSKETYRFLLSALAATCPCIYDEYRKLSYHISNEHIVLFSCFMFSLSHSCSRLLHNQPFSKKPKTGIVINTFLAVRGDRK